MVWEPKKEAFLNTLLFKTVLDTFVLFVLFLIDLKKKVQELRDAIFGGTLLLKEPSAAPAAAAAPEAPEPEDAAVVAVGLLDPSPMKKDPAIKEELQEHFFLALMDDEDHLSG